MFSYDPEDTHKFAPNSDLYHNFTVKKAVYVNKC